MEWLGLILVVLWLGGNMALFSGDINDENAILVILTVIVDFILIIGILTSNAEAKEKKRIEDEKKRIEKLTNDNLTLINKYKIKNIKLNKKSSLFKIDKKYQISEIISTVELLKKEIQENVSKCIAIKLKIDEILTCPDCDNEDKKSKYLNDKLKELDELTEEYTLISKEISQNKVELLNEDSNIYMWLKIYFDDLLMSKKCFSDQSNLKAKNFIINKKPKELSLFKYQYDPIILYINSFYFCLFSKIVLVFDSEGDFINALTPTAVKIRTQKIRKNIYVRNDIAEKHSCIDSDSALIQKGITHTRWTHTRLDGGPDLRYSYNPQVTTRTDIYEYGIITIEIGESKITVNVSSQKAINGMESISSIYLQAEESTYDAIPNFLKLVVSVTKNDELANEIFNYYVEKNSNKRLFCKLIREEYTTENYEETKKTANDFNQDGLAFFRKENYFEAEKAFRKGLALNSNDPYLNFNLGNTYMKLDNPSRDIDKALYYLNISIDHKCVFGYRHLGMIYDPITENYGKAKDIDIAMKYYDQGAKMKDADSCNSLGVLYGDYKKNNFIGAHYTWLATQYDQKNQTYKKNYQIYSQRLTEKDRQLIESIQI